MKEQEREKERQYAKEMMIKKFGCKFREEDGVLIIDIEKDILGAGERGLRVRNGNDFGTLGIYLELYFGKQLVFRTIADNGRRDTITKVGFDKKK